MIKLQVKIILWIFIISETFLCGAQIENINSNELFAFEDFLCAQHLQHAIVLLVPGSERELNRNWSWPTENYKRLLANYWMQFFTPTMGVNFKHLFYYEAPRTALLVEQLENIAIKRWAYQAASEAGYFNSSQAWLILGSSLSNQTDEHIIKEHLSAYNINVDADITVAMRTNPSGNSTWLLYDVYRLGALAPLRVEPKGVWNLADGYQLYGKFKSSWLWRRQNLDNFTLIGSTTLTEKPDDYDLVAYLSDHMEMMHRDSMQRKTYQLFQLIGHMYNFRFDVRLAKGWGELLPNGSWTGVVGQVERGDADFSLLPIRYEADRLRYVQYSPMLHTQLLYFLFRHPRHNSIRNIFFEPLSSQVWWCVLALVVCSTMLLALHIRQEQRLQSAERPVKPWQQSVAFVWFTMLETYLQQGPATELFRLPSTRVLISASCLFSFMLMQFYSAFIVGSLLSESPRSIVNLQALYASNLEIGMENISYNFHLFSTSPDQLVRDIYSQRICRTGSQKILTLDRGAERIKQGGFAFHAAVDRIYRILVELLDETEFCELQEIKYIPPIVASSVLAKTSPWREHMFHALIRLSENGLLQYHDNLWTVSKPDCTTFKAAEVEVDLKHFAPALFTLLLAMLASGAVFLLELMLGWLNMKGKMSGGRVP